MAMLLDVRGLTVELPTPAGWVRPLNDVSFRLEAGETLGLVGESGGGKTMLGLALMGLEPPGARRLGEAWLTQRGDEPSARNGRLNLVEIAGEALRSIRGREIAMVFQEPMTALNPVLRIGAQIEEAIRMHAPGLPAVEVRRRLLAALERAAIPEPELRARQYPHQLSGGLRQRAMIAMALAAEPRLLIADEPTTALDVTVQKQILQLLVRLRDELDLALLFITHDLGVVAQVADRLAVMYAGRIVEEGPASEVLSHPCHPYTEGLLRSVPQLRRGKLLPIPGTVPGLSELPPGCAFEPRCPYRVPECSASVPELRQAGPAHFARCILIAESTTRREEREQQERVRERFTRSAEPFAKFVLAARTAEADILVRLAAPRAGDVALDLACGPGTFARAFARRVKFVHGLDLTPALLAQALRTVREEKLGNVSLTCGDAYVLPYRDSSFDLAMCGYSFHHMSAPARVLSELARVLRPGGRVAVVDMIVPTGADPERNNQIERARDKSHARTMAASELASLLESAGFRVRASETAQRPRSFAHWMSVAGWQPGGPAWVETERLMNGSMAGDAAGFHPRFVTNEHGERAIEFVQTSQFLVGEKA